MEHFQGTATSQTEWSDPEGNIIINDSPLLFPQDKYAGWKMTFNVTDSDNGVKVIQTGYITLQY